MRGYSNYDIGSPVWSALDFPAPTTGLRTSTGLGDAMELIAGNQLPDDMTTVNRIGFYNDSGLSPARYGPYTEIYNRQSYGSDELNDQPGSGLDKTRADVTQSTGLGDAMDLIAGNQIPDAMSRVSNQGTYSDSGLSPVRYGNFAEVYSPKVTTALTASLNIPRSIGPLAYDQPATLTGTGSRSVTDAGRSLSPQGLQGYLINPSAMGELLRANYGRASAAALAAQTPRDARAKYGRAAVSKLVTDNRKYGAAAVSDLLNGGYDVSGRRSAGRGFDGTIQRISGGGTVGISGFGDVPDVSAQNNNMTDVGVFLNTSGDTPPPNLYKEQDALSVLTSGAVDVLPNITTAITAVVPTVSAGYKTYVTSGGGSGGVMNAITSLFTGTKPGASAGSSGTSVGGSASASTSTGGISTTAIAAGAAAVVAGLFYMSKRKK